MPKVTVYTNRLTDRDKQTAREEILKGNQVRIYPTCINNSRSEIIIHQSEELFKSLGASPVEEEPSATAPIPQSEYVFWSIQGQ